MQAGKPKNKQKRDRNPSMSQGKIDEILDGGQKISSDWFDRAVEKDFPRITKKRAEEEAGASGKRPDEKDGEHHAEEH